MKIDLDPAIEGTKGDSRDETPVGRKRQLVGWNSNVFVTSSCQGFDEQQRSFQ